MHASMPVPQDFAIEQSSMVQHCLSWHNKAYRSTLFLPPTPLACCHRSTLD